MCLVRGEELFSATDPARSELESRKTASTTFEARNTQTRITPKPASVRFLTRQRLQETQAELAVVLSIDVTVVVEVKRHVVTWVVNGFQER